MTQTYQDPQGYLNNLVSKKGKSGFSGVYATNVTVLASASADYGYKVNLQAVRPEAPPLSVNEEEWFHSLVVLRSDNTQEPLCLNFSEGIYQFIPEGPNLSLNVFLPAVEAEMFAYQIVSAQDILSCAANFSGKDPCHIRFNIGYAKRTWEELAEEGEVEERELSY